MMYAEVITNGLPDGFSIHMDKMGDSPRQFKLLKDGVFVASGDEFDARHIAADWAASYYAAPKVSQMIDGILDKFRAHRAEELEEKRRKLFRAYEHDQCKAELAALHVLGME